MAPTPEQPPRDLVHRLHEQLEWHWQGHARPRLEGLTDEEYLWRPVADAWTVRPRAEEPPPTVNHRAGAGEWQVDYGFPEPSPAPVTTIAWRLAHLVVGVFGARNHSHFDGPPADYDSWDYPGTAAGALAQLDEAYAAWSAGVRALSEEELWQQVGEAEGPWWTEPMITLVLHINREAIHHLAEVALLRDLWAHRGA